MPTGEQLVLVLSPSTREGHVYHGGGGDGGGGGGQVRRRAGAIRDELYVLTRSYAYNLLYRDERYKSRVKKIRLTKDPPRRSARGGGKNRGDKGVHATISRAITARSDTSY